MQKLVQYSFWEFGCTYSSFTMSRCCWYTNNKLYISGARIPYHFFFSLLSCFNNGKYFDRFSVTCYTIVKFELLGNGKCLPIFWEYLRNFPNSFSIFNICFLVTCICHKCFQFMSVDAAGLDRHIFWTWKFWTTHVSIVFLLRWQP